MKFICITLVVASVYFATGCESCDNCSPDNIYPYFNINLINNDTLILLQDSLTKIDLRLNTVKNLIPREDDPEKRLALTEESTILSARKNKFAKIITNTRAGLIKLDTVYATKTDRKMTFPDSSRNFRIPLDMEAITSDYLLKVSSRTIKLRVVYTREEVFENNFYKVRAFIQAVRGGGVGVDSLQPIINLKPATSKAIVVDSLQPIINFQQATSNETTIRIYF